MQYSIAKKGTLNEEFRIDAEYYSLENLSKEDAVTRNNYRRLGGICELVAGPFGSTVTTEKYDATSDKRYIRGKDIQSFFIEKNDAVFLDNNLFDELPQFHLREEDILLTVVGMKFGKSAIVSAEDCPAVFSCKSTLVRSPSVNVWYLLTYLSSSIGYGLVRRGHRGAAQPGINLFDIRNVPVPILDSKFQSRIEILVKQAKSLVTASDTVFVDAQTLLLFELGLADWQPRHQLTFVKNYSDAGQAERIDAEYFQPKYEEIVNVIKGYKDGWDTLGNLVALNDKNYKPKDKQQYKYIELANITGNGEIADCMVEEGQNLPSRARRKVKTGDLIVSSIEGSLSSIALIDEEYEHALCSTGFHVIKSKNYSPETLLVLLKSMVGQLQLKKGCSGTILTAINKEEFGKVVLPIISTKKQSQIQQKVTESFNLRKQAKHLLECTKRAVEMAIESDEQTAIDWLENETKEMRI